MDIALVTCAALPDLFPDDRPLARALGAAGLEVGIVCWDDPDFDWGSTRIALLRSPWDYFHRAAEFLAWAERAAAVTQLVNPLPTVRWNLHKGYLVELAARGLPVVPTALLPRASEYAAGTYSRLVTARGWADAVVKPAVSADSWETIVVRADDPERGEAHLARLLPARDMLVQPFLRSVETHGERSLVLIEGQFSHAVRKNALTLGGRRGDVPEGVPVEAAPDELAAARLLLTAAREVTGTPEALYARVDLARDDAGNPLLLELELAEPTLFLAAAPAAIRRLVASITAVLARTADPALAGRSRGHAAPAPPNGRIASRLEAESTGALGMDDTKPLSESALPVPAAGAEPAAGAHYRVAFDNSHEAIIILQDGRITVANRAAARISASSIDQLIGASFLDFVHPADQSVVQELYLRRLGGDTGERSMVAKVVRPGGGILALEVHSMPVQWNDRPAVLAFLGDVTDREQVRSDAQEMSRRLARIAEVAPYFLFIYDYDLGRDIYINRSVPAALGYSPAEAAALGPYPFEKLCHPDDMAAALDRDARWQGFVDGSSLTVDFRMRHRNGEWRWFRSHNTPFLRDDKGRIRQILGMTQDVTESKRSEELLRRTERLESLGLLAGGIAHDFSNLLTPIVGNVELLLDRLPPDSPLRDRALAISAAADRATELARQLLVYAGRGEIEPRPIDLNALVEDVVHLLRALATHSTATRLDLAPRLPPIRGDSSQLRSVILNLLSNAHEAIATLPTSTDGTGTGQGQEPGRVLVRTRRVELRAGDLGSLLLGDGMTPGPAVLLEVIDNGSGMEVATMERIWEPFFTTKERGRGLGLPSVLGILRAHRAAVALESHPRSGTQIRVYFAAAPPAQV